MPSNQPIVLLKESNGGRVMPIWIGGVEATAIAAAQQGVENIRPMSHDLMRDLIEATGATVTAVHITGMRDGIFYAQILMRNDEGELASVSARPSDAIALAMRTQSNILVDAELLGESAIDIPHEEEGDVEAFREFLENIEPEDFE